MFLKGKKQYHKCIMSASYPSYGFHLYLGLASLNSDNLTTLGVTNSMTFAGYSKCPQSQTE